jgi:transposase-like protein
MVEGIKSCRKCGSEKLVKNGNNAVGNAKYKCNSCGFSGVIESKRYDDELKEQVVKASLERSSSRGLARTYGISHQTALRWIKKKPRR